MRKLLLLTTLAAAAMVAAGITVQAQTYGPSMMGNDQDYGNRDDCGQGYGMMRNSDRQTNGQGQGDDEGQNQEQSRGYGPGYHMRGSGGGYGRGMMQGNDPKKTALVMQPATSAGATISGQYRQLESQHRRRKEPRGTLARSARKSAAQSWRCEGE